MAPAAAALAGFEAARRPIIDKLIAAANASAGWYEDFAAHMALEPPDFVMSDINRSGRVDLERLPQVSPRFVAAYRAARPARGLTDLAPNRAIFRNKTGQIALSVPVP